MSSASTLVWKCRYCHKKAVARGCCEDHISRPSYRPVRIYAGKRGNQGQTAHSDPRWKSLSREHLSKNPMCLSCRKEGRYVPATIVDHILPVRHFPEKMFDETNLQSLCNNKPFSCHQRKTGHEHYGIALDFVRNKRRDFTARLIS